MENNNQQPPQENPNNQFSNNEPMTFAQKVEYVKSTEMTNNKQLSLIDALCIIKTGWRTEQEKELLDNAYLLIKQHSEILHLEYQKQCIEEKLTEIQGSNKCNQ